MKKRTIIIAFVFGVFAIACETSTYSDIEQAASTNNNVVDDDDDIDDDNNTTTGTSSTTNTNTNTNTGGTTTTTSSKTFTNDVKPIITANCISCHNTGMQSPILSTYTQVKNATSAGKLICTIQANGCKMMPPSGKMSQANIDLILLWKSQGYLQ